MPNGGTYAQAKAAEHTMLGELAWLWPVGILTLGAIIAIVLTMVVPRERQGIVAGWVILAHLAATAAAVAVWLDLGFRSVMEDTIHVDGLGLTLAALIGVAGALCVALARPVLAGTDREGEFYAVLTFASLCTTLLGMTADAALLGLAIGALGLATFVMTGYMRTSPAANEAAIKYYIFGTVSGAVMLYGLSWWFGLAGTTNLQLIGTKLAVAPDSVVIASTALVLVGLGYKAAIVPFHFWTPDAYAGAPIPVAAYLSVLPKLAGLIAIARVLSLALPHDTAGWSTAIAIIAAATMTLGNLAALPQRDVVRLLAYSSIAQSGYMLMAVAAVQRTDLALPALVYYSLAYAAMNLAAFAVVLAVHRERGSTDLDAFRGLGRSHPWWTVTLILAFLSLLGLPPLAGFVGKLELFTASIDAGQTWLAAIAVVNTVISLYYYLRVIAPTVLEPASAKASLPAPAAGSSLPLTGALIAGVVATVGIGVAAEPLLRLAEHARMI